MCFYNYKIRSLLPSLTLSKSIEKSTTRLNTIMGSIEEISSQINDAFEDLKKANIHLTKLAVQATRLKEKKPKLKDLYKEKEELVSKLNQSIALKTTKLFNRTDLVVKILERITFNADAVLYKENKRLNKFIAKTKKVENKELSQKILSKINLVKADIKTAARKLYEASRAEEEKGILEEYPSKESKELRISEEIKKFGLEAAQIDLILKKLTVTNIDEISKNAEKLLTDLKKIELDVMVGMNKLEEHFVKINALLYLLEDKTSFSVKNRLKSSKEILIKTKKRITEHAKNLLKDIEIVKKIK
jgi:hypothetical protein